jgi:hypothetical protein
VPSATNGTDRAQPIIQIQAFVRYEFFSYLSAKAPPKRHDIRPTPDMHIAFKKANSGLYSGKTLPKNTGKNAVFTMPPKFLKNVAINTFLEHERLNTYPLLFINSINLFSFYFLSIFIYISYFYSIAYFPLTGSLIKDKVEIPKIKPKIPIIS